MIGQWNLSDNHRKYIQCLKTLKTPALFSIFKFNLSYLKVRPYLITVIWPIMGALFYWTYYKHTICFSELVIFAVPWPSQGILKKEQYKFLFENQGVRWIWICKQHWFWAASFRVAYCLKDNFLLFENWIWGNAMWNIAKFGSCLLFCKCSLVWTAELNRMWLFSSTLVQFSIWDSCFICLTFYSIIYCL